MGFHDGPDSLNTVSSGLLEVTAMTASCDTADSLGLPVRVRGLWCRPAKHGTLLWLPQPCVGGCGYGPRVVWGCGCAGSDTSHLQGMMMVVSE